MTQPSQPGQPDPSAERSGTIVETDEEIRQAMLGRPSSQPAVPASSPHAASPLRPANEVPRPVASTAPAGTPSAKEQAARPFRPTARPPVALLTVFDDGRTDGEIIRLREPRFLIGRTEGDLRIPLDARISARHLEITYQNVGGLHRWVVTDLQSTHGLLVRVSRTVLSDKTEFLVGGGRYRFDAPLAETLIPSSDALPANAAGETHGWGDNPNPFRPPALSELLGAEIGNRTILVRDEYWIGSDANCQICRPEDPFCEPRHARLFRKSKPSWNIEHNKTPNGLWVRMPQLIVESTAHFQIGEQRFQIKIP